MTGSKLPPAGSDPAILRNIPLFSGLTDADLEMILREAHPVKVPEGGFFFFQGDQADHIYMLAAGQVKLTQTNPEGQQVIMRLIGPGTLFGGIGMAQAEDYPVNAQAVQDSSALAWHKTSLMRAVERSPRLALNAIQMMASQVQEYQERFRQLATERVERRLARSLLRLAAQSGRKIEDGILIDLPLSRQDLAEMNGTTLFTVSRLLSQWETQGLVSTGRQRVVIRFPHGLVRIAEDLPG